jgi:hypothetical protein
MPQTEATAFLVMSAYARAQELLSSRQQTLLHQGAPGQDQPSWPFVSSRTLIGRSAHQTRNASDLRESLVTANDLTGACRLPPAF